MMRQMRENTKWIMLVTALAFVGLMIFQWGMDASGRSSAQMAGGELGRVNGEPVTYEEFNNVYRSLYQQREQQQQQPLSSTQNKQIEDAAWKQIVQDRLIEQELERRGIRVTDEEVKQAARYSPPPELYNAEAFQTNGQFDLQKYQQFLSSNAGNGQLLMQLENYYRSAIPRDKLFRAVAAGIYVTDGQLWRLYRDRNEAVRVQFVQVDPQAVIPDAAVSVSDKEVRDYYDTHQSELKRPASAKLQVVSLPKTPTAEDTAAVREHALDLRKRIEGGADFAELAKSESSDKVSAEQGGELGTLTRGQTVPPFDEAVFSLPIGQLSQPVLTQYGYHLIQVENRWDDSAKVRHILLPIQRQTASENRLLSRADSLEAMGGSVGIDAAAKALGLNVRELQLSESAPFLPLVGQVDEGADWVFNTAQAGETSTVFENDQAFYMFHVIDLTPAGIMSFDETRDALRNRIMAQKKLERARQVAREVVDDVRRGSTLEQAAQRHDLQTQQAGPFTRGDFVPGLGSTNAAIGTAFGLKAGEVSGVVEADERLFVIKLLERTAANRQEFDAQKEDLRQRITAALEQARLSQFMDDLQKRAEIVDNHQQALHAAAPPQSS